MASSSRESTKPPRRYTFREQEEGRSFTETRKQAEQGFREWLDNMAGGLKEFFDFLPAEVSDKLDFSVDSLDVLEAWLLAQYPCVDATRTETNPLKLDGAARYIGETFRKHLGGHWHIDVDDPRYGYFDIPELVGMRTDPGRTCPLSLATMCTDRRFGDLISSMLRERIARLPEHEQGQTFAVPGESAAATATTSRKRSRSRKAALARRATLMRQAALVREAGASRKSFEGEWAQRFEQWERDLQKWLADMDRALASFFDRLPAEVRAKLDHSIESLDVLEAWLLARYPDYSDTLGESERPVLEDASRYIGETFCKVLGGHWRVGKKYEFGRRVVTDFRTSPRAIDPSWLTTTAISRRRGTLLSAVLRNHMLPMPPEPEPEPEQSRASTDSSNHP